MNLMHSIPLLIVAAYLFGSVPYGVLAGALHGVDVTAAGSRNIGATNVGRLLGRKWGMVVFFLDMFKGFLPTLLAVFVVDDLGIAGRISPVAARLCCLGVGFASILGHNYSIILRFKGGRGVATTLGVCLGVYPDLTVPALVAFAIWALVTAVSRYVSLGSVTGAVIFPFLVAGWSLYRGNRLFEGDWPLLAFALLVALLGIYRHRANLERLMAGTEHKFGSGGAASRSSTSAQDP